MQAIAAVANNRAIVQIAMPDAPNASVVNVRCFSSTSSPSCSSANALPCGFPEARPGYRRVA